MKKSKEKFEKSKEKFGKNKDFFLRFQGLKKLNL